MVRWTDDMIAELRSRRSDGVSLYMCAERIGVGYATCVYKARELGLADRMNRGRRSGEDLMAGNIAAGSGVRHKGTGVLGRTFRNPQGNIRGHIWVQWDGARDRETVSIHHVTLVAAKYETAKGWDDAGKPT